MKSLFSLRLSVLACAVVMFSATWAQAQTQIRGRVLVTVDTSGSMLWHFNDCVSDTGDSGTAAVFCDNNIGTNNGKTFACMQNVACTTANGGQVRFPATLANPSRLYAAKAALNDVINSAGGVLDFGLERYALNNTCADTSDCCTTQINGSTQGRCVRANAYPSVPFTTSTTNNLTFNGGCGTSSGCTGNCGNTEGGQVLIAPSLGSSSEMLRWVDYTEDFCSSNGQVGGPPRNPELRANGSTPLAGSVRTARRQWYQPIFQSSNGGSCDPNDPLCDPQINCRPYVHVVMTDGAETCEDSSIAFTDPQAAVAELSAVNSQNPVKTYVIGMSFVQNETCNGTSLDSVVCPKTGPGGGCRTVNGQSLCACTQDSHCGQACNGGGSSNIQYRCGSDGLCHHPALDSLNAMALAGGTQRARFANNQVEIEAAFADIVASSVRFETCNNADDNCNGVIDEGFDKGGTCSVGTGICQRSGVIKCAPNQQGTACCTTGGDLNSCTPLTAGPAQVEVCNGRDDDCDGLIDENGVCQTCNPVSEVCDGVDNDCDNIPDNNLIDVGLPCGINVGECRPGTTVCQGGQLVCQGGTQPTQETCNNKDDDCDGVIDGSTLACYTGPAGTAGVGPCRSGQQSCESGVFGPCTGEILPTAEQCNGIDDDCDGQRDNGATCPSGSDCLAGQCLVPCISGEFPCPTGFACDNVSQHCFPAETCTPSCAQCERCSNGVCVDRCLGAVCPSGTRCDCGVCVDDTCITNGCPSGQVCDLGTRTCVANPCLGKTCGNGEYCDPATGDCVSTCPQGCPQGQRCRAGTCQADPCGSKTCAPDELCNESTGNCQGNPCIGVPCSTGQVCVNGSCQADTCGAFTCPSGTTCQIDPFTGTTSCARPREVPPSQREQIVGAGGGAFACSVQGTPQPGSTLEGLAILGLVGVMLARRRKRLAGEEG